MKARISYLKEISLSPREFDAVKFVAEVISREVEQLRHASFHSLYHRHVLNKGYPVPSSTLDNAFYATRPKLERDVDKAIRSNSNLYLIGCEGSGKTTLLHYVISRNYPDYNCRFVYIDISDIGITESNVFNDLFFDKLRNALFQSFDLDDREQFMDWISQFKSNPFSSDLVNTSSTKRFVEAMMIYFNASDRNEGVYFIIDNIDSLSKSTVEDFFSILSQLESTVASAFLTIALKNRDMIRFIICCRTQSIGIVTSASYGLFTRSSIQTIDMDERFTSETDIIDLTKRFIEVEGAAIFGASKAHLPVSAPGQFLTPGWTSFTDYAEDVFLWLGKSRETVNRTITGFCGRSIRRSKLFLVKVLASPIIARLTFYEKHRVYNITRNDPAYLSKRILESMFDFSTSSRLQLPGYPLNPFGVLRDARNFRFNPLLGVAALLYMHENLEQLKIPNVRYAQSITSISIVMYLESLKFESAAIVECFESFVLSGLLRPIRGEKVIVQDHSVEDGGIVERYILDDHAFRAYIDLLLFKKWSQSLTFYNMALRYRYSIRSDYYYDNLVYDSYTLLAFLLDLLDREKQLEEQIKGSGVMFRPLSARIRHVVFTILPAEIEKSQAFGLPSAIKRNKESQSRRADLISRTLSLLDEVRFKLSRQAGIF